MGLLFENFATDLIFLLTSSFMLIYVYFMHCYKYWERRNIPYIQPKFPYGNCRSIYGEGVHFTPHTRHYYDLVRKKGLKYAGIYIMNRPVLILRDPEYIKDILTKDFETFPNRTLYYNEQDDPISAHLFAIHGARWKNLRSKLTPAFTSGKMKIMFPIIIDLSDYLTKALDKAARDDCDVNILEYSSNFTTDVVCNVAFGLDSNTFENPNSEFRRMAKKLGDLDNIFEYINMIIIGKAPSLASKLRLVGTRKDVANYFHNLVTKTTEYRKENNVKRSDFLQLLIELKDLTANSDNPFTLEQLISQSFLFFIAGFDTSSTTLLFTFYELSKNQEIQEKVREELETVLEQYNGELTYESLGELKYLQQVIDETQRLYPPLTNLDRVCTKEYKLRNSNGVIGEGVTALISILSLHRDPEYYPNPETFDPERFNAENKSLRHPYLHLPFGGGPRNCIGARFGLMQVKIGLAVVLRRFRLTVSSSTKPLVFNDHSFFLRPMSDVYLKAEKL